MQVATLRQPEAPREEIGYEDSLVRQRAHLADRIAALTDELEAADDKLAQIERTLEHLRRC